MLLKKQHNLYTSKHAQMLDKCEIKKELVYNGGYCCRNKTVPFIRYPPTTSLGAYRPNCSTTLADLIEKLDMKDNKNITYVLEFVNELETALRLEHHFN